MTRGEEWRTFLPRFFLYSATESTENTEEEKAEAEKVRRYEDKNLTFLTS